MSKILRKNQKIFGSTAGLNQIAEFGSLAAGTPTFTTDPEMIQALGNYLTGWFGAVIGGNSPAIEDMNALCYLFAYQLSYVMQAGIPEYNAATPYYIGSMVTDGANGVYISNTNNNTGNALTSVANWFTLREASGILHALTRTEAYGVAAAAGMRMKRSNGTQAVPTFVADNEEISRVASYKYNGASFIEVHNERIIGVGNSGTFAARLTRSITGGVYYTVDENGFVLFANPITVNNNTITNPDFGTINSVQFGYYYEGQFAALFSGFTDIQGVTVRYQRTGKQVTLTIPPIFEEAGGSPSPYVESTGVVPVNLRPTEKMVGFAQVKDSGDTPQLAAGMVYVADNGDIRVYQSANESSNFDVSPSNIGWTRAITFTYSLT